MMIFTSSGVAFSFRMDQLFEFAFGSRTNDTSQQMRNVARRMAKDEVTAAAQYFAALKPEGF
jgi:cytochrome c553